MKSNKGFTLIELIVVVVALGILAAAALPRFMNVSNETRSITMEKTANSVLTALYTAEHLHNERIDIEMIPDTVNTDLEYTILGEAGPESSQIGVFHFLNDQPIDSCRVEINLNAVPAYDNDEQIVMAHTELC